MMAPPRKWQVAPFMFASKHSTSSLQLRHVLNSLPPEVWRTRRYQAIMSGVRRFGTSVRRVLLRKKHFDTAFYLTRYPDIAASRMHPFAHYLLHGAPEGRKPNAWFEPIYYLARYEQARARGGDPFADFLKYGAKENLSPHPLLDRAGETGLVTEGAQFECDS